MQQFTLKDFLSRSIETGQTSFKIESLIESRLISLNPLCVTDDYLTGFYIFANEEIKQAVANPSFNKISLNLKIAFREFEFSFNESALSITVLLRIINPAIIILKDLEIIRLSLFIENVHENPEIKELVDKQMGKILTAENTLLHKHSSVIIPMAPTKKKFLAKPTSGLLSQNVSDLIVLDDD